MSRAGSVSRVRGGTPDGRRRAPPDPGGAPAVGGAGNGVAVRCARPAARCPGRAGPVSCGRLPDRWAAPLRLPGRCRSETRGTGTGADLSSLVTVTRRRQPCRAAVAASLEGPRAAFEDAVGGGSRRGPVEQRRLGRREDSRRRDSQGGAGSVGRSGDLPGLGRGPRGERGAAGAGGGAGDGVRTGLPGAAPSRVPPRACEGWGGRGPSSAGWLSPCRRGPRVAARPGRRGRPGCSRLAAPLRGPRCGGRPRCRHLPGERGDHRDAGADSRPGGPGRTERRGGGRRHGLDRGGVRQLGEHHRTVGAGYRGRRGRAGVEDTSGPS